MFPLRARAAVSVARVTPLRNGVARSKDELPRIIRVEESTSVYAYELRRIQIDSLGVFTPEG